MARWMLAGCPAVSLLDLTGHRHPPELLPGAAAGAGEAALLALASLWWGQPRAEHSKGRILCSNEEHGDQMRKRK
eukprot:CAMPEP_0204595894 /NCGR_PEP_ID=MMETSP0661-20131031/52933_1 /ASSEMBLY_ACC=CAM_ASM_000606 /TAXON_ID=109239 /ORGANISM="Alexandrium margalefi, Strain AMGDE01CS-322" /LENGTH=74 /DNA_ID=CAMNT_0051606457 /DNA_START=182 /DNA_END=404 /DNA_ORIENTATION=+